jgi:hypothetical protein
MKKLLCSFLTVVASFLCVIHSRADTIYVGCALDGTIRQYATNGVGLIFRPLVFGRSARRGL